MKRRGSTTSDSSDENDFHRFDVNRKRSVRPATREEEAKFLLAYAKRELNDEKYDKLKKLLLGFLFRSVSTDDLISQSLDLVEGDKYLFMSFDYFFHKRPKIDPSLETQHNVDPIAMLMVKDEGKELIDKIEKQLKGDSSTRKRFLNALNSSPLGAETLRKLGVIFKNNENILKHLDSFYQNPTTYLKRHEGSRETLHNCEKSFHPSSQTRSKVKLLGDSQLLKKSGHSKITPSSPSSAESSSEEINGAEEGNDVVECDYSTHPRVTPSYVLLPENDQVPKIEKPNDKYLNSHCISVASLDRRHCFKSMHHNKYAKELFVYEDKRFEMDITISSMESAIERAKKRLAWFRCKAMETTEPDPLSVRDLRLVEGMRDRVLELREILRDNEAEMLPSILQKLKQKKVKWEEKRSEFNKEWSKVVSENYYKAMDHSHCCPSLVKKK